MDLRDFVALTLLAADGEILLGQRKGTSSMRELAGLAPRFGWSVSADQIKQAAEYLGKLGLVELTNN